MQAIQKTVFMNCMLFPRKLTAATQKVSQLTLYNLARSQGLIYYTRTGVVTVLSGIGILIRVLLASIVAVCRFLFASLTAFS